MRIPRALLPLVVVGLSLSTSERAAGERILRVRAGSYGWGGDTWQTAYRDLQQALSVAEHHSGVTEIWVAQGTYKPAPPGGDRNIEFRIRPGLAVYGGFAGTETDRNQRDPALHVTVLSGDLNGDDQPGFVNVGDNSRNVLLVSNYGNVEGTVLDGFTITGGNAEGGKGGGLQAVNGPLTIQNCLFTGNRADEGGGLFFETSGARISRCVFVHNFARRTGGGIHGQGMYTIEDCVIESNTASAAGTGYGAAARGGGLYHESNLLYIGTGTILRSVIRDNASEAGGGGITCARYSVLSLGHCLVLGNRSRENGGGIAVDYNCSGMVTNCVLVDNFCDSGVGGGIFVQGTLSFANSIARGNTAPLGPQVGVNLGPAVVLASNIEGGRDPVPVGSATLTWSEDNIDADPLFAFPGDYHLMAGSPCIDAGTNSPPGGLSALDFDGHTVPLDGDADGAAVADMGVYELDGSRPLISVDPQAPDFVAVQGATGLVSQNLRIRNAGAGVLNWNLSSECPWLLMEPSAGQSSGEIAQVTLRASAAGRIHGSYSCPLTVQGEAAANSPLLIPVTLHVARTLRVPSEYPTIQAAIDAAVVPGDTVLVADGTYVGPGNRDLDFRGRAITVRSEHGPSGCVIDCQGAGRGFWFHLQESKSSVLNGFTIINGSADVGGAIRCDGSSPTIRQCILRANYARYYGGGISLGGNTQGLASPIIDRCVVDGNSVRDDGGGIACGSSRATIVNSRITNNSGKGVGGIHIRGSGSVAITGCLVGGNSAKGAGAILVNGGLKAMNLEMSNCTIVGNTSSFDVPAVLLDYGGSGVMRNCVVWGNTGEGGRQVYFSPYLFEELLSISHCVIQGGRAGVGPSFEPSIIWGPGNIDADPLFRNPDGPDADPATWDDNDYSLALCSPAIGAGSNALVPPDVADLDNDGDTAEPTSLDLAGGVRFLNAPCPEDTGEGTPPIVDIGAYEFDAGPSIRLSNYTVHAFWRIGLNPPPGNVMVWNGGEGTLDYAASSSADWFSVGPVSGSSTGEADVLNISFHVEGLPPGSYQGTVAIAAPGASNSPQSITVYLEWTTVAADFDGDGDVDQSDFGHFQTCLTGPQSANPLPKECENADLNADGSVDQSDFGEFQRCLSGASMPPSLACEDPGS